MVVLTCPYCEKGTYDEWGHARCRDAYSIRRTKVFDLQMLADEAAIACKLGTIDYDEGGYY